MSPPEVFAASLATCVGVYVLNFAKRHDIRVEGMKISADWQIAEDPRRVLDQRRTRCDTRSQSELCRRVLTVAMPSPST